MKPGDPGNSVAKDQHPMVPVFRGSASFDMENKFIIAYADDGVDKHDEDRDQEISRMGAEHGEPHQQEHGYTARPERQCLGIAFFFWDLHVQGVPVILPVEDAAGGCDYSKYADRKELPAEKGKMRADPELGIPLIKEDQCSEEDGRDKQEDQREIASEAFFWCGMSESF